MSSIWQCPEVLFFVFSITISSDYASYFLEMNMLISLKGTLSQTGMGVGRVSLPSEGPMRGQYVFFMAKCQILIVLFSVSISRDLASISLTWLCLLVV